MEHVVFFPAHDGTPAFRRVGSLEDAVRLVEHLRNVESINEVSVHTLAEVPLSFRTVIKVEVPSGPEPTFVPAQPAAQADAHGAPADERQPAAEEAAAEAPVVEVPAVEAAAGEAPVLEVVPDPEPVLTKNGRGGNGPKSLGFFA